MNLTIAETSNPHIKLAACGSVTHGQHRRPSHAAAYLDRYAEQVAMRTLLILLFTIAILSCAPPVIAPPVSALPCEVTPEVLSRIEFIKGSNPCYPYAITLKGASCSRVAVAAERKWLSEHYPGYRVVRGGLETSVVGSPCPLFVHDSLSVELPSGETITVTFDITEFYGK